MDTGSLSLVSFATGLAPGATLIIAIGAQNAFVLRQGLRREHIGAVNGLRARRAGSSCSVRAAPA